jgi:hypothetical protein
MGVRVALGARPVRAMPVVVGLALDVLAMAQK